MLVIFLLTLIPLLLLGTYILSSTIQVYQENVKKSTQQGIDFIANDLSANLTAVQAEMLNYTRDPSSVVLEFVGEAQDAEEHEHFITLMYIQNSFVKFLAKHDLVQDLTLYYPKRDICLSAKAGLSAFNEDAFERMVAALRSTNALIFSCDGFPLMVQTHPLNARNNASVMPEYMIVATLSTSRLKQRLETGVYGNCPTILLSENNVLISANANEGVEEWLAPAQTTLNREQYLPFIAECPQMNCSVFKLLPNRQVYSAYHHLLNLAAAFAILAVVLLALYILFVRHVLHRPVLALKKGFERISSGELGVHLPGNNAIAEFDQLFADFNAMTDKLQSMTDIIWRQELFNMEMELKQLQAQINPHFLYNSFFVLKHFIQNGEDDSARDMANYLEGFFQYITRNGAHESTIGEEYEHAISYLNIQSMRYQKRLVLQVEPIPAELQRLSVPRLIFQPLIENVFAHSKRLDDEPLQVRIRFSAAPTMMETIIEDSGNSLSSAHLQQMQMQIKNVDLLQETTGMFNIHRRLQLRFGSSGGLDISRSDLGGLKVSMRIPILKNVRQS